MSVSVFRRPVLPALAAVGLLLAGCGDRSSSSGQPGADVASGESQTGQPAESSGREPNARDEVGSPEAARRETPDPDDAVTVRVVDEKQFDQVLKQHRGKVVLVDFWATWCLSCLELFPHTVELHQRYADRGLAVISLSMDDPDDEPAVLKRLQSNKATFGNFISRYGGSTKSADAFGLEDLALPRYHLYDRTGKLRQKLRSGLGTTIEAEDIDHAVKELLDES